MKLSKTALKILSAKYRAVLLKCLFVSAAFISLTTPAMSSENTWEPKNFISGDFEINKGDKVTVIEPDSEEDEFQIAGNLTINDGTIQGQFTRTEIGNSAVRVGNWESEEGTLVINDGKLKDLKFRVGKSITIKDGSFKSVGLYSNSNVLDEGTLIKGGTFKSDTRFEGNGPVTISGGKFYDYVHLESDNNVNLKGGDLTNVSEISIYADKLTIDSDKVNKFSGGKEWASVSAKNLIVTEGSSGLLLSKVYTTSETFNGHITTNNDAYIGSFGDGFSTNYYKGNIIYSVDEIDSGNVTFEASQLTLNKNSQIGAALITANFNHNAKPTYEKTIRTLTNDEINNSIKLLIEQIQNSNAPDADVFEDEASGNTEFEIDTAHTDIQKLIEDGYLESGKEYFDDGKFKSDKYVESEWDNKSTPEFKHVMETVLKIGYAQYQADAKNYNPEVTIKNSTIVMNNDSAIINYGKNGTINVSNSIITANGNNKVLGLKFADEDGKNGEEIRGTLTLNGDSSNANTLYINGKLDTNITNTGYATINNFDNISGTTKNTGTLTLTGASDKYIAKIEETGNLILESNTVISKSTLDNDNFKQTVQMNTGSTLDLRNLTDNYALSNKLKINEEVDVLLSNGNYQISKGSATVDSSAKLRLTGMDLTGKRDAITIAESDLKDYVLLGSGLNVDTGYLAKYSSSNGTITFEQGNLSSLAENEDTSTALKVKGTISETIEFNKEGKDKVIKSDGSDMTGNMKVNGKNSSLTLADSKMKGSIQAEGEGVKVVLETAEQNSLDVAGTIKLDGKGSQAEITSKDTLNLSGNIELNDTDGGSIVKIEAQKGLITGSITSKNSNNKLIFSGNIDFNGFFDPADAIIDKGIVNSGEYNDAIKWTVNQNSTLKYLKDTYLYDNTKHNGTIYHKNSVVLNGGTLDLANGVVNEIQLASFELTQDSFLSLDADLTAGIMDTIKSETTFENSENYIITISNLNLINPKETTINYKFGDDIKVSIKCDDQIGDYKVYYVDGTFYFTYNPQPKDLPTESKVVKEAQKAQAGSVTAVSTTISSVQNVLNGRMMGGFKSSSNNSKRKMRGKSGGDYYKYQHSRTQESYNYADEEKEYGLWAQGLYNHTDRETTAKTAGFKSETKGFVTGFDAKITDQVSTGIAYSFAKSDITGKTDVDTHTFMLYGQYKPNNFFMNVNAGYGMSKTELKDNTKYDSDVISANTMFGYEMGDFTPYAEGRYTHVKTDSYKRNDEEFKGKSVNVLTGVAGLQYSHEFNRKVKFNVGAAATYDFVADNNKLVLKNAGIAVETERTKRLGGEVNAGIEARLTNNWSISAGYTGNFKTHYQSHTGTVSAAYNF